ncbi:MAG TPA: 5-(carboxyamino)imidazole ribonucleotide synthase [Ignavibacteriales bacterium]|nr:5-(carboxyamino)imidazole ribonucleotide synthase [Ignavibacteriales bacterium]HOL81580.1 5-(carboxyamino)imidazole ribonucleotide synthase [Ignavibacteriales bacterium]HOM65590.1 5-(carboxyamino)imidazole ribonucleotide synthase [Ignavibacteriales bacterium]HPP33694.1 5-(carboxyamino)imidazole ribonucleotide synthase [Ignavibacteriales bacterium]HRR18929.1 5-(carboxyamino)imidazole ribonucleotide synthase [Ignavibacteriales bacterium]
MSFYQPKLKLGIITGGQLGKMLIQEASKFDISTFVMDSDDSAPASEIATKFVHGNLKNYDDVYKFGKMVDVLTIEIESVNVNALKQLEIEGIKVFPQPFILEIFQNKYLQKKFYIDNNIPTAKFLFCSNEKEVKSMLDCGQIEFPFVQKLTKGGYDGRGVAVINTSEDLIKLLPGECIIEDKVKIDKEIAVIVARNYSGEIAVYEPVEMVFNQDGNLVEEILSPARIDNRIKENAKKIAIEVAKKLNIVGLLAIEYFIDTNKNLFVNEAAPRKHNSGHHTIDSTITSQFEQHLRAILDFPLGSTYQYLPCLMYNLIGEPNYQGDVYYQGLDDIMKLPGVKIHLYGKKKTFPFRKMGHINIVGNSIDELFEKLKIIKNTIKVIAR